MDVRHWHIELQAEAAERLAVEDRIAAAQAECVVDRVANADIFEEDARGLASVVDAPLEIGLALQDAHGRAGQLAYDLAVANQIERVQAQHLVGRIEADLNIATVCKPCALIALIAVRR